MEQQVSIGERLNALGIGHRRLPGDTNGKELFDLATGEVFGFYTAWGAVVRVLSVFDPEIANDPDVARAMPRTLLTA